MFLNVNVRAATVCVLNVCFTSLCNLVQFLGGDGASLKLKKRDCATRVNKVNKISAESVNCFRDLDNLIESTFFCCFTASDCNIQTCYAQK